MTTDSTRQQASDAMYAIEPERAWSNSAAVDLYQLGDSRQSVLGVDLWSLVGREVQVIIPNGLTGEDRAERVCTVTVTDEMVRHAYALADDMRDEFDNA